MEPKWDLGPIWREDGSGEGKKGQKIVLVNPVWRSFLRLWGIFFHSFLLMLFGRPLCRLLGDFWAKMEPKGSRNGAKMEAKASLGAPSGKCKKHGRGYVFST